MKILLVGNPNVGKSTIFNKLTGLHQHTGNWTGKTVANAYGRFSYNNEEYEIYDLPGTYSLFAHSKEEKIAFETVCFSEYDAIIVVCDANCLERNLILVLQILEVTSNVVLCINLIDEATKNGIIVDLNRLSEILGIEVVGTTARTDKNLNNLIDAVNKKRSTNFKMDYGKEIEASISYLQDSINEIDNMSSRLVALRLLSGDSMLNSRFYNKEICNKLIELNENYSYEEEICSKIVKKSEEISTSVVKTTKKRSKHVFDKILTNKIIGSAIMMLLLIGILFLTIKVSNYPSDLLFDLFSNIEKYIVHFLNILHFPAWLISLLIDGVYRVLSWVISVMLPPMAIFFPLFTLLEDLGFLPRIAFNVDGYFKKSSACGKQALTMCMGLGCNAVGITGTRIIDSNRERLIAILTNVFTPCNGRFPAIIAIISIFFTGENAFYSALILALIILGCIFLTLFVSFILSKTILKGYPSAFILELPSYRKPQIGKVIVRSIFDRTIVVLYRAVVIAVPFGALIWFLANISLNNNSLLYYLSNFLNPLGSIMGLDGAILLSFILGFPANEIVIPAILMCYMSSGSIVQIENLQILKEIFVANNWNIVTAICMIVFMVCHAPCSTTCLTIKHETKSNKWTLFAIFLPVVVGSLLCMIINILCSIFL